MSELTHFNAEGRARMVDVSDKKETKREATAKATIFMKKETIALIQSQQLYKGDVLGVATVGGIMGAKKTADLIPMCHSLYLSGSDIRFDVQEDSIEIFATIKTTGQTGIEMEALTAASVAALTIYDMCKAVDKEMVIGEMMLVEKIGGKSGHFIHPAFRKKEDQ